MANIALQDGKVVLKDGKVSCSCCATPCNLCESVLVTSPLLQTIQDSTSVSVTYDFPAFEIFPQVSGTETLPWDGVSAFKDIQYDGFILLEIAGNCFRIFIIEVSGSNRAVNFYTTGQDCGFPTDSFTAHQFFTIPVNGNNIDAFQYAIGFSPYPPGFYPTPTISISFS